MKKPRSPSLPPSLLLAQFGILYFFLAVAAIYLSRQPGNIAALWFANALAIAYLISQPRSFTFFLLTCAALGNFSAHLALGDSIWLSAAFVPGNVVEIWIAASLVRHTQADEKFTESPKKFLRFILLACCIPPLLGATAGAATVSLTGFAPFSRVWSSWYTGTTIGSVGMLPIILLAFRQGGHLLFERIDWVRTAWFALLSLTVCIFALIYLPFPFIYIMVPLIVAAVNLSFEGTAALMCLSSIAMGATMATGYFVPPAVTANGQLWMIYLPVLFTMISPMIVAAGMNRGRLGEQVRTQFEETQAQLQSIIDSASEFAIIATGLDGTIQVFSAGAERMLGYRPADVVDKLSPFFMHVSDEVMARGAELSAELGRPIEGFDIFVEQARQGHAEMREWTYARKDGSRLPVSLVVTAIHDIDGRINGFLGIAKDITQQKQLQSSLVTAKEQAEAASRAKSEFVANMSHEIRTPLNAVLGMAYLMGNTPLSSDQKKYLDMIRVSGQSLLSILNDILDFSKIEAGRLELSPETFQLGDVLNALANIMTVNAGEKDLELAIGIEPGVPHMLLGDALRLQQVLVNLTGNAIKFTEQGEIAVLVEVAEAPSDEQSDRVLLRFCIRDTGIGMDAGQQAGLFSAFSQADSSITRRFGGTGLGLAICKRLVELMGGSIDLRSTLGEGSEFRVTLPLKVAEAGQGANPLERLDDLHLLVVDDNQTSRDYLCKTIQAWNWRVDSAASGAQGIECLRAQNAKGARYDMVLVDWQMPGMDGLATMHALREMLAESATPVVIMVNAFGRGKLIQEKTASQADAILIKPVTGSSLFDALHESLAVRSGDERKSPFEPRTFAIHHRIDGAHLLLVEDNPLNQIVAKGMLEQAGATVDVADNGLVAIGLLSGGARNYDLILMDVQMPVMDGFATTRTIRDELKLTIPILAMTAGVMLSEREQCTASGMNDFIAKPIDIDQMFGMIVRYLPARSKAAQDIPAATGIPAAIRKQEADPVFDPAQLLMVAEDNPAYRSQLLELIRNVVERSPDQILDARLAWKEGRIDDAARVFHTLRGPIGMLGAKQFTALSLEIENAIRSGQAVRVASLFDIAEQNLNLTVAAARHWLEQQAIPDSELQPDASADQFEFAQVERLRALLSERDLEACDVYTELRTSLHGRLALEDITALDVAMERLQFREVLQQLQRLME